MEGRGEREEERLMELLDSDPFRFLGSDLHHVGVVCSRSSSSGGDHDHSCSSSSITKEVTANTSSNKKQRRGASASRDTIMVRKDKLGDKIAALQQLVSPFGKSDTASVLLEALGYIRFLHDQVQVLSSPYLLQRPPTTATLHQDEKESRGGGGELRSRGLCLVPVSSTEQVANDRQNGADLWSSPTSVGSSSSSLYFSRH